MTDNEILKALECHSETSYNQNACERCPILNHCDCGGKMAQNALDLINRQRAEIERFEKENHEKFNKWEILNNRTKQRYAELYEEAKAVVRAEAIKEFAERLKEKKRFAYAHLGKTHYTVYEEDIDELVQEMVGDEDC